MNRPRSVSSVRRKRRHVRGGLRALTLIELLVVTAIIAALLSILLPSLAAARSRMKALKCLSNLRTVGFQFHLFVEGENPEGWGDSRSLNRRAFYINDFQDYLYRVDEFWDLPHASSGTLHAHDEIMLCPAGASQLTRYSGYPCSKDAIRPLEDVSLAVNMRLHRAVVEFMGSPTLAPAAATHVRTDIRNHPYVPLLLDVDGHTAVERGLTPFYTAPALAHDTGPYADDAYWLPSERHAGRTNVTFVGGHVLASKHAARAPWDWAYQADVGP